jgi:hypothetical protein
VNDHTHPAIADRGQAKLVAQQCPPA